MRTLAWFTGGFAAACLICCLGEGLYRPVAAVCAVPALAALLLLPAWGGRRAPRRVPGAARRALVLCLGAAAAALWTWGWTALLRAPAQARIGEEGTLAGTVASYPAATSSGGCSLTVELTGPASPRAAVFAPESWSVLVPGDRVTFSGRLSGAEEIGGEETAYYTARGIFLLGYARGAPEQVERPEGVPLRFWPALCARRLKESLYAAFPEDAAPLAVALVTGDKSGLSQGLTASLDRAGASHTVVVSGMHLSALVMLFLLIARRRRRTALILLPLLLFYALMAGGTPSALRAVAMQAVLLAAPFARREYDPPSSLALAVLLLLLADPYSAASASLQLSAASVAGMLTVTPRLLERWERRPGMAAGPGRLLAASLAVSLGAMAFSQPVLACYFGSACLVFPLTDLLVLPAVELLMPCALLVGTAGILLPGPAWAAGRVLAWAARYIIGVVTALGRLPFASVDLSQPAWLLFALGAWAAVLIALLPGRGRPRPAVPLACAGALLAGALLLSRLPVEGAVLSVTVLDVGQGASTALISGGRCCLVDCGGNGRESAGDVAADYFASLGIVRLDALVLTHLDADHVNGVARLLERMETGQILLPRTGQSGESESALLELAAGAGVPVEYVEERLESSLGEARIVLYPPMGAGAANEEGLLVLCSAGEFDALIPGDAPAFVEHMLVKYCALPDLELLVAGHHGAASSTSEELLDALRPEVAAVSVGRNSYGHPSEETLERLAARQIQVLRTDELGSVCISVTGQDAATGGYTVRAVTG